MEKINIKRVFLLLVFVLWAVLCKETVESAYCQNPVAVLMLQQSPANGGIVSPGVGVHEYGLGDSVRLTAVPRQGYHFVSWLGDVGDASKNSTTVILDTPKIIIAIFERISYDFAAAPEGIAGGYSGGQGVYQRGENPSPVPSLPGTPPYKWPDPPKPPPPMDPDQKINVEDEPIPEPATIVMMSLGVGLAWLKRGRGKEMV